MCDSENRETDQVLILIAFEKSLFQSFLNAVITSKSVIANYSGRFLGACKEVTLLEGHWPKNESIGFLLFENPREAGRWTYSDPIFRNQDFLDQVEMYAIPLRVPFPSNHNVVQLMNLRVSFPEVVRDEYFPQMKTSIEAQGGRPAVTATGDSEKVKGCRKPDFLIVNTFPSMDAFEAHYGSESYSAAKELRQQGASGDVLLLSITTKV